MDVRHLRYFKTVAELGGFSAAARRLGVAQPALSRHVKALEQKLGFLVFRRGPQGVRLTPEGERLLEFSDGLLRQFDMLPDIVGGTPGSVSGRVVVGFPTSVCAVLARPLIRAAARQLPQVRLHVVESLSGFLREWIEAGRLDICVLYDAPPGRTLVLEHLLDEDLCLVGAPGAFPPGCTEIPFQRLADQRLAMPGPAHSLRQLVEGVAARHGVALDIAVEIDSMTVIKGLAESGDFSVLLPRGAVQDEIAAGRLRACRIVEPTVSRSVSIATSSARGELRACAEVKRLIFEISAGIGRAHAGG